MTYHFTNETPRCGSDGPHRGHITCIIGFSTHSQWDFSARIALYGYVWGNAFYFYGGGEGILSYWWCVCYYPWALINNLGWHICSSLFSAWCSVHVMWPADISEHQVWILTMVVLHLLCFFLSFCFAGEPEGLPLVVTELITHESWELFGTRLTCPLPCWHLASWLQEPCKQDGPPLCSVFTCGFRLVSAKKLMFLL